MKLTSVTLSKHYKIGLPQYSNITVGATLTWELAEGEQMDYKTGWDIINNELDVQAQNGLDPSWITHDQTKDKYKTVIRTPKSGPNYFPDND